MTDAQVTSSFIHAVQKRKYIHRIRYLRVDRAVPDHSAPSGFVIGEDGSIILDDSKRDHDGGNLPSSSQPSFSLAAAKSTASDQPNRQTQTVSTMSSALLTKSLSLSQTSPVVYISQGSPPPVPSPSLASVLISSPPPPPAKTITETQAIPYQISSEMFTALTTFFTTTTLLPSRSSPSVVATATTIQSYLPVAGITSTSEFVHQVTITTMVPASGTNSQLSTTIVMLTTDDMRTTARGAGKAITNGGSGTNPTSGTAALPSGLPSSDPEFGLKVSHNPPLIIGLVLGSILLLSACAAGAGWILRARRRWQDHRIAALGVDTRNSFGNASALFVPDPTWYREESKESDSVTHRGDGSDTRRASVGLQAEQCEKKGNEATMGVGTSYGLTWGPFGDSSAPQQPANTNPYSYNYPSTINLADNHGPAQYDRTIPISVVPGRTRSANAPLSLPITYSTTGRFSRRSTFGVASGLPTPAFPIGGRTHGELSGNWRESILKSAYRASIGRLGYGEDPLTTSRRPDFERKSESNTIAQVGTVDQNYETGGRSPLRVVGELTRQFTIDTAGTLTGSRVEEKLKRMREKRRELESV